MARDRRQRSARRVAVAGAGCVPPLAKLHDAGDGGDAGAVHVGELRHRLFQHRDRAPVRQFRRVRARIVGRRLRERHFFRLGERAHQYPLQGAVFCAVARPADHSGDSLHGVLDIAGEPEDRHHQLRAAGTVRHRFRLRRHLFPGRHDFRRRHASIAARVPVDDGGVPRDGSRARGIRPDERRERAADRPARDAQARLAGGVGGFAHPLRARRRIVRGPGAAGASGRDRGLYVVHLPGDPKISERGRSRLRLRGQVAADHLRCASMRSRALPPKPGNSPPSPAKASGRA